MHPFAAHLPRVAAAHDRDVVFDLRAPDHLVDVRLQKERIPEAEAGREPHARVGGKIRRVCRARPRLARVREVEFVELVVRKRRKEVRIQDVDAGRIAFRPVRRGAVAGHVERLVLLARVVEVGRRRQPALSADVRVGLQEHRKGLERVIDGHPLVHAKPRLKEVQERNPLAVGFGVDERGILRDRRRGDRARRADRAPEVLALEIAGDAFDGEEVEGLVTPDRSADRAAELLAMKILELGAVGQVAASAPPSAGNGTATRADRCRPIS